MRGALAGLLLLCGCHRLPAADTSASVEVANLTLSFPREEQGDLYFEVVLPRQVARVTTLRWELFLGQRRFAEGVVLAPDIVSDAGGRRSARVQAPLVYRHLGWREGSTWLDVGLRGDVQPFGAGEGGQLSFRARRELLVTAAPVLEERAD
ncbi:MAG: hypothetical protein IAE78_32445 [Myxococcus sp.]|nr:hypothetical protein [Myxococcus sp.]